MNIVVVEEEAKNVNVNVNVKKKGRVFIRSEKEGSVLEEDD